MLDGPDVAVGGLYREERIRPITADAAELDLARQWRRSRVGC